MPAVLQGGLPGSLTRFGNRWVLEEVHWKRGRLKRIYSDNGRTFVGAVKWVRAVRKDVLPVSQPDQVAHWYNKISPTQVSGEWYVEVEGIGRCCSWIAMCCQSYNLTVLKRLTFANEPTTCLSARRRCGELLCAQATAQGNAATIGDLVMVQTEERNRGLWPLSVV